MVNNVDDDDDVDAFLDDMLDDFDREQKEARTNTVQTDLLKKTTETTPAKTTVKAETSTLPVPFSTENLSNDRALNDELAVFMQKFSQNNLSTNNDKKNTGDDVDNIGNLFQNLLSNLDEQSKSAVSTKDKIEGTQAAVAPASVEEGYDTAMKIVAEGAKDLLSNNASNEASDLSLDDEMLERLLGEFKEVEGGDDANMDNIVEQFLGQMLSKDALYPSLKKIVDKFPTWLQEKKDSLSSDQLSSYQSQLKIFKRVTNLLESNKVDTNESRAHLLQLIGELQQHGLPPPDLMEELMPGIKFDEAGIPISDELSPDSASLSSMMEGAQNENSGTECSLM